MEEKRADLKERIFLKLYSFYNTVLGLSEIGKEPQESTLVLS